MEQINLLPAIELLMHHTGKSFQEACAELGANEEEIRQLLNRDITADILTSD